MSSSQARAKISLLSRRFLRKSSKEVLEERLKEYLENPAQVTSVWRNFFRWNSHLLPEPIRTVIKQNLNESINTYSEYLKDVS